MFEIDSKSFHQSTKELKSEVGNSSEVFYPQYSKEFLEKLRPEVRLAYEKMQKSREITNLFDEESLQVVDHEQIKELEKWQNLDFDPRYEDKSEYISEEPVVIVCGCGRSGTTLTRVILDSNSNLYSGPESLLFLPLKIDFKDLSEKFKIPVKTLLSLYRESSGRAEFIEKFNRLVLQNSNKKYWVDKTARNIHKLDYILEHFPNAKIINVVRDGRDVITSLKSHRKRKVVNGELVPTGYDNPLELCVRRWELAMEEREKVKNHPNVLEVRYENLTMNSEVEIRKMCDFIGVEFEPAMLDHTSFNEKDTRNYLNFPQNVEVTKPISTSSVGRFKTDLTPDQQSIVEKRLRDKLIELGYDTFENKIKKPDLAIVNTDQFNEYLTQNPDKVKEFTKEALYYHLTKQVIQPPKTYLQTSDNPYDRIIALPAAIAGDKPAIGIKWIGSHSQNTAKGLERANALIILNDPETNAPKAIIEGGLLSTMRTFAINALAIDKYYPNPKKVGILGFGKLSKMHLELLPLMYESIDEIKVFTKRLEAVAEIDSYPKSKGTNDYREVLNGCDVIISLSDATTPYIANDDLRDENRLIINTSLMDFGLDCILNSNKIVVDDYDQNSRAKKVFKEGVDQGILNKENVKELSSEIFDDSNENTDGRVFVNPLGMGLEDVYVANQVLNKLDLK